MNEARVQRSAYLALAFAFALALVESSRGSGVAFGLPLPFFASLTLALIGAAIGIAAVVRRSDTLALSGAGVLVLSVVPAAELAPGYLGYALAIGFGGALLFFVEFVHQTARHARAQSLVKDEGVSEASLDRVTDEALRTLASRAGMALGLTGAGALVALLLSSAGPAFFREGIESQATLGVAVWSLLLFAIIALYVVVRGAKFPKLPERFSTRSKRREALPVDHLEVVAADAVE